MVYNVLIENLYDVLLQFLFHKNLLFHWARHPITQVHKCIIFPGRFRAQVVKYVHSFAVKVGLRPKEEIALLPSYRGPGAATAAAIAVMNVRRFMSVVLLAFDRA